MGTSRIAIRWLWIASLSCSLSLTSTSQPVKKQPEKAESRMPHPPPYNLEEAKMLARELKGKGIRDKAVLAAIARIPREAFVDEALSDMAYLDRPLLIEAGQTISQPYTVARQTELLRLDPGDKVLEIGTGSGYQAAVLCEMGVEVYSVERYQELYQTAQKRLNDLGYYPHLFHGDGYEGLPEHAPFDKILITAAPEMIPPKLTEQLGVGGRMVLPLGGRERQQMTLLERVSETRYNTTEHGDYIFVPMQKGRE